MGSGGEEQYVDNKSHEWAAKTMPNAHHVVIPDAGHTMWRQPDTQDAQWWSYIDEFISSVEALKPEPEKKSAFSWLNPWRSTLAKPDNRVALE